MVSVTSTHILPRPSLTIIGGGPGGYEAALVAAKLGAQVTIIESKGMGGSAVLTDVVPSKTLIATADSMRRARRASGLGVDLGDRPAMADMRVVDRRLLELASQQSRDIHRTLERLGVRVIIGHGRLAGPTTVEAVTQEGTETIEAEGILIATGASPRELPTARPDGERIFNWTQVYNLTEVPEHMIVIGSGVTGAEFASAYNLLGSKVTLVSSRDRVLPGEDQDAAAVLEDAFAEDGVNVVGKTRAESVERTENGVRVHVTGGRVIEGSHCLVAVGGIPNTAEMGLAEAGIKLTDSGHIAVDGVSRTSVPGIYAAGDCTGVFALASVAAMQGRVAVAHLMGDSVKPFQPHLVSSNVFTSPEIATVGVTESQVASGKYQADILKLDLATNPRAKMQNVRHGFVKIFARKGSGTVIGGVVVAPRA
jgi:NAD(P)H dehydrogenase (quinone)